VTNHGVVACATPRSGPFAKVQFMVCFSPLVFSNTKVASYVCDE